MAPSIELTASTFSRLQALASPLVDTPETVINRLIDAFEKKAGDDGAASGNSGDRGARAFNPNASPDLTHTKILSATLNNQQLGRGQDNWNGLLNAAVRLAKAKAKSTADLKKLVTVNFVEGQKTDEGYRHFPDLGISVQGQDANGAWRAVAHIAQKIGCQLTVTFAWREKEGAAFPGVTGQFVIDGQ